MSDEGTSRRKSGFVPKEIGQNNSFIRHLFIQSTHFEFDIYFLIPWAGSLVSWIAFGTARSTFSGSTSCNFFGTIDLPVAWETPFPASWPAGVGWIWIIINTRNRLKAQMGVVVHIPSRVVSPQHLLVPSVEHCVGPWRHLGPLRGSILVLESFEQGLWGWHRWKC